MRPGSSVHPCHSRSKSSPAEQGKKTGSAGAAGSWTRGGRRERFLPFRPSNVPPGLAEQTFLGTAVTAICWARAEGANLVSGSGGRGREEEGRGGDAYAGLIQAQECAEGEGESAASRFPRYRKRSCTWYTLASASDSTDDPNFTLQTLNLPSLRGQSWNFTFILSQPNACKNKNIYIFT